MSFLNAKRFVGALAGMVLTSGLASAASITGNFNLTGTVYDTATSISFGYFVAPTSPGSGDMLGALVLPFSGSFSDLSPGTYAGIADLTTTSMMNWITLPDGININLTSIPVQTSVPVCSGSITDNCRAFAASPVVLSQGTSGVTAQVNFDGMAYYTTGSPDSTPIIGKFAASVAGATIPQIVATINSGGYIETSYEADFIASPSSTTPEPASMALLGAGLFGLGLLGKKKFSS